MSTTIAADEYPLSRVQGSLTESFETKLQEIRLSLAGAHSAITIKPPPLFIKLAYFHECSCEEFDAGDSHLCMSTEEAELNESHGVALSYAWGEFDREPRLIGHWATDPSDTASITLGAEWRLPSFKRRLAQLTAKYGACWIDQFCMPQNEEKVRLALAKVPKIYETLPVVALLPGSLCKCLKQAVQEDNIAQSAIKSQLPDADESLPSTNDNLLACLQGTHCLNSSGSCSYGGRIWTFQEYHNSRTFSVLRVNEETASCFLLSESRRPDASMHLLNDYLQQVYKEAKCKYGLEHLWAVACLSAANEEFFNGLAVQSAGLSEAESSFTSIANLLLGDVIIRRGPRPSDEVDLTLHMLATTGRKATKEIDYILSTMVGWKHYKIPEDYHTRTATQLLENSLEQLRRTSNLLATNRSPAGLFGASFGTARWDSRSSREGAAIRDSTDVLAPLTWERILRVHHPTRMPLKLFSSASESLGSGAQYFDEWEQGTGILTVINDICDILSTWSSLPGVRRDTTELASAFKAPSLLSSRSRKVQYMAMLGMLGTLRWDTQVARDSFLSEHHKDLVELPPGLLESVFYGFVCEAIRLDSDKMRQQKVRLVFAQWQGQRLQSNDEWEASSGTYVGFVNGPLFDEARLHGRSLLTIAAGERAGRLPFYEAVKRSRQACDVPEFAIIGIWLPLRGKDYKIDQVGAEMVEDNDEHDAIIV